MNNLQLIEPVDTVCTVAEQVTHQTRVQFRYAVWKQVCAQRRSALKE